MANYKLVGVNEKGARVGETHHRAILTDHDVDLIRALRDEYGLTYQQIADKFECGRSTVRDVIKCRRRWQRPEKWKRVPLAEKQGDERSGIVVDNELSSCLTATQEQQEP